MCVCLLTKFTRWQIETFYGNDDLTLVPLVVTRRRDVFKTARVRSQRVSKEKSYVARGHKSPGPPTSRGSATTGDSLCSRSRPRRLLFITDVNENCLKKRKRTNGRQPLGVFR